LCEDARALEAAGADMLLVECVSAKAAQAVQSQCQTPLIGIGAGSDCDGQILVLQDMLGITPGQPPSFSHDFMADAGTIPGALSAYAEAVRARRFPGPEHGFD